MAIVRNANNGKYGCCAEVDIWEASFNVAAYTLTHVSHMFSAATSVLSAVMAICTLD